MRLRYFELPGPWERDRAGLRSMLNAMQAHDAGRLLRHAVVHFLAILGALLWCSSTWPERVPAALQHLSLQLFPIASGLAIATLAAEIWLYRRQERLIRRASRISVLRPEHRAVDSH
jgi:hypothetical protein